MINTIKKIGIIILAIAIILIIIGVFIANPIVSLLFIIAINSFKI